MNGGGGVGAGKISLRLQYYVLLAGVGAVLLVGCLKYMPAAAVVAAGYGSWGSGLAVASRAAEPEASPVVIFNFGDSNSDTGGMAAASGLNIALPEGRTYFRRPTGRLSDGRLVIDFICESLGTPHLSPYLKALGSDFSNGANFAIGGSTATPGGSPFSLDVQLHQFLYFRTRSFELLNKGLPIADRPRGVPERHLRHRHRAQRSFCLSSPPLRSSARQDPCHSWSHQVRHGDPVRARGSEVLDPRDGGAGLPAAEAVHPQGRRQRPRRQRLPQQVQRRRQGLQREARRDLQPAPAAHGRRRHRLHRPVPHQV
uniref:GDSL esterase/lipase n=1 Tax=Aegilops tauschii subsp. strangulata TaxID=200361 RepID=A0A453MX49_AEGTS